MVMLTELEKIMLSNLKIWNNIDFLELFLSLKSPTKNSTLFTDCSQCSSEKFKGEEIEFDILFSLLWIQTRV